jgi:hypothetical protein
MTMLSSSSPALEGEINSSFLDVRGATEPFERNLFDAFALKIEH